MPLISPSSTALGKACFSFGQILFGTL